MDLKDMIAELDKGADEAHRAFHAGHYEVAEEFLRTVAHKIAEYLGMKTIEQEHVTEATDIQTPANEQTEKPAAAPGASLHPGPFGPDAAARQAGHPEEAEKQTQ